MSGRPEPRVVSEAGRAVLARAVSIDHDWSRQTGGEDELIEALGDLSDQDLAAAAALAHRLDVAVAAVRLRRWMAQQATKTQGVTP